MASLANGKGTAPRLFLIDAFDGRNPSTVKLFQIAARQLGIECKVLYASAVDFTNDFGITEADLLYGISAEPQAKALFKYLAATCRARTIFKSIESLVWAGENVLQATILHQAANLPINKTVYTLTRNRALLDTYVKYLGGFPVIVKAVGGSHGVGVMRFDSAPSLYAGADFLLASGQGRYIMRQFIDHESQARLIVLGGEVIDSIEYIKHPSEFRTNVGDDLTVRVRMFSEPIERMAIDATSALGADFGGVDILIDTDGNASIVEVNTPCFFARSQNTSGTNIANKIIQYLLAKPEA